MPMETYERVPEAAQSLSDGTEAELEQLPIAQEDAEMQHEGSGDLEDELTQAGCK